MFQTWRGILQQFARSDPRRFDLDAQAYELLHHDLLFQCRRLAYGDDKETAGKIRDLVAPWVNLHALEDLEGEHRRKLLDSAQVIERTLRIRRSPLGFLNFSILKPILLFCGLTTCVTAIILAVEHRGASTWTLDQLESQLRGLARKLQQTSLPQRFQIGGVAVAILAILLARSRKLY